MLSNEYPIKEMIMNPNTFVLLLLLLMVSGCGSGNSNNPIEPVVEPPFHGTIFISPDIITASDPTSFIGLTYQGKDQRQMFDRRVDDWVTLEAFLFDAEFNDGLSIEVQVNPEFTTVENAEEYAVKYAISIGQLPTALRVGVETVWIHQGTELFGGGNNNILIHTGQAVIYETDGILEETLVHEAAHSSLDQVHANASGWLTAQQNDPTVISRYARDNPIREDIAESVLVYLAVDFRSHRLPDALQETIRQSIPHRLNYFRSLSLSLHPFD